MSSTTLGPESNESRTIKMLDDARDRIETSDGEIALDLSSVDRVDPGAVISLDRLASKAEEKAVKVVLRGVNVDVYKVLKLVKLAHRFSFTN